MGSSEKAKEKLTKSRTLLLTSHPFYGYIGCRLRLREENNQPTMATDGLHLFYNSDFVNSLSYREAMCCIAHEVSHVYLKHFMRGENLSMENWQIFTLAQDMAINPRLKDGGFEFPKVKEGPNKGKENCLFPEKEHWNDCAEEHYRRLKKMAKKMQMPCGGNCSGTRRLGKELTSAERAQIEADTQIQIFNAAEFARAAGKLPADIERMVYEMRKAKVSWTDVMRRFMTEPAKQDYRMMPPNRRFVWQGLYMPSLRSETVSDVLLMLDGSGSTMEVFPQFIAEFVSVYTDIRPERLHVMVWDTQCTYYRAFEAQDGETAESITALQSEMGAGGGTVLTECFEWFERETGIRPQIGVVLTDMELFGEWPGDPDYPVLWVATTDTVGPYGETVRIEA